MSSSSNPSKEEIEDALANYDSNKDAYQALKIHVTISKIIE